MIDRYTLPKMKELWSEEKKFRTWLEVEIAVCEAWNKLDKVPSSALRKIKDKADFSIARVNEIEKTVDHDVIAFLTAVSEKVGPDSRFIHLGMTSSDLGDTALSMLMRDAADLIIKDIEDLIKILGKKAKGYKDTIMMGRTHGVHAEPMTFGLKLALWMVEMQRNLERMQCAREIVSVGKLSGAVGTYSNIDPRIEKITCEKLGLKPAIIATQTLQRDRHAEYLSTIAIIGATIEKIALEIRLLQKTELSEVEEPFKKGQKGSSAMPHKKNPITCERLCGLARILRANSMVALENVALWHERDISHSSAERIILPDSTSLIDYMLQTTARIIDNLVVYPENMKKNIEKSRGLIFSSRLLLALVDKGLTREDAYKLVQSEAMRAKGLNKNYKDIVSENAEIIRVLNKEEIEKIFDIKHYLRNIGDIFKRLDL